MKNVINLLIVLLLALFLSACSSSVYFNTSQDPSYTVNKDKSIFVVFPKNPSIEDKKLFIGLQKLLKEHGYKVVSKKPSVYDMVFDIQNKSKTEITSYTDFEPTFTYGMGAALYRRNVYVNVPVSKTYTSTKNYKIITLDIKNTQANEQGRYETVWSGMIQASQKDFQKNPKLIIDQLVKLIGQEFKGDKNLNLNQ